MVLKKSGFLKENRRNLLFFSALVFWPVLQFVIFYIVVNFNSIRIAFIDQNNQFSLENFKTLFVDLWPTIFARTKLSFKYFFITAIISVPLSLIFSYYIYKKLHFYNLFRLMLFLPSVLSTTVLIILYFFFANDALPDILWDFFKIKDDLYISNVNPKSEILVLIFYIWFGFGTSTLIYSNSMGSISPELNEAMKLDGANSVQEFIHLVIPSVWPTITMFIVTGVASLFTNQYNLYTFFGGNDFEGTLGHYLYLNVSIFRNDPLNPLVNKFAALGVMCTLVTIPLTFLVRYLLEHFGPSTK